VTDHEAKVKYYFTGKGRLPVRIRFYDDNPFFVVDERGRWYFFGSDSYPKLQLSAVWLPPHDIDFSKHTRIYNLGRLLYGI
jgi:hypothetical protein